MKLELGPFTEDPRLDGLQADLLCDGEKVGSVHQHGHEPQWAFEINKFRHKYMWDSKVSKASPYELGSLQCLLFDGAAWDTAEQALWVAQDQLTRFLEKFNAS